jgi:cullin-4
MSSQKRKHSERTIRELFTSQQKPNTNSNGPVSPTSKRARLDSDSSPPAPADAEKGRPGTMSTANMYHFPSKNGGIPKGVEIVDLSSSPPNGNSPVKPTSPKNGMRKVAPNMHANGGPKRMLVKNFKPARKTDPKVFFNDTWAKVDKALDTVFEQGKIDFSLEELYRGVENLCRQGMAQDTSERLVGKCRTYIEETLKEKIEEKAGWKDVDVLRATLGAWATWMDQMVRLLAPA